MKFLLFFIFCFSSCNTKNATIIHIVINKNDYGWHFFEQEQDSTVNEPNTINVVANSYSTIPKIKLNGKKHHIYKVYDNVGNEITDKAKLPAIHSRNDKYFFAFYYPTNEELSKIKTWLPSDMNVMKIDFKSDYILDSILNKKNMN